MYYITCVKATIIGIVGMVTILTSCKKDAGVHAAFSVESDCLGEGPCDVTFINQSQGARSYLWDFGDGRTSIDTSPIHTYSNGLYFVARLDAIGGYDQQSAIDTIFLGRRPACEIKGTLGCTKQLVNGKAICELLNREGTSTCYYYLHKDSAGPAVINLSHTPSVGTIKLELLSAASSNSPVLASKTSTTYSYINLWVDSLPRGEYYLRLTARLAGFVYPFLLTYVDLNAPSEEPNDFFRNARPLIVNGTIQGTIQPQYDTDYFIFNLSSTQVLDFIIDPVPSFNGQGYLDVEVHNDNTFTTRVKQATLTAGKAKFSAGPMEKGEHYIRLKTYSAAQSNEVYRLTMQYDSTDKYESNQTFQTATEIFKGQSNFATIKSAGDVDYYKCKIDRVGYVTITVPYIPNELEHMVMDVFYYASENNQATQQIGSAGGKLEYSLYLPGVYTIYIKISANPLKESNTRYEINIK